MTLAARLAGDGLRYVVDDERYVTAERDDCEAREVDVQRDVLLKDRSTEVLDPQVERLLADARRSVQHEHQVDRLIVSQVAQKRLDLDVDQSGVFLSRDDGGAKQDEQRRETTRVAASALHSNSGRRVCARVCVCCVW